VGPCHDPPVHKLGFVAVLVLLAASACTDSSSSEVPLDDLVPDSAAPVADPAADLVVSDVDWDGWTPVYGELRPADDEAVAEIRQRVTDLNASSWTAHEALTDTELAYTPEHARGSWDHVDLHVDPREDVYDATYTACLEDGCVELDNEDGDAAQERAEAMLGAQGAWAFGDILRKQLGFPDSMADSLDEGEFALAAVESPAGPWDCLVNAERRADLRKLLGTTMAVEGDGPVPDTFVSWCVDGRGLVLLDNREGRTLPQYDSWHPGVDGAATQLVPAVAVTDAPIDAAGDYEGALWATWQGVYEDVRPATRADVARLRARVKARNRTSWTGVVDVLGAEVAVSPRHARVRAGIAEWHFEPGVTPMRPPYVLCVQEACVRVGKDADSHGLPHLFNNDLDWTTFTLQVLLAAQWGGVGPVPLDGSTVSAVVDSPVGPLDCLVSGEQEYLSGLEGAKVGINAEDDVEGPPFCVDQRGLVQQVDGAGLFGIQMPYTDWHEGVMDDIDDYPFPVRDYNQAGD
jgi:hypothetical protein